MKDDLVIQEGVVIPAHELDITTSRSGGPGGQHVNKTDTRVTIRWNLISTNALDETQKTRVLQNLHSNLTSEGDLLISNSTSRSQLKNKELALEQLAYKIRKALYIPKKRKAMRIPKAVKESRLQAKAKRSLVKKLRSKNYQAD